MARSKASNQAQYKYNASHLKRVPLDLQLSDYERLKSAAESVGQSVNGYIKQAISERMEREDVQPVGVALVTGADLVGQPVGGVAGDIAPSRGVG